jgi:hypothetical protein
MIVYYFTMISEENLVLIAFFGEWKIVGIGLKAVVEEFGVFVVSEKKVGFKHNFCLFHAINIVFHRQLHEGIEMFLSY